MKKEHAKQGRQGAQTVQKAIAVLKFVATRPNQGSRLLDIAHGVAIERPTVHRLLQALVAEGLIVQDDSRKYRLGPLIFELSIMGGLFFNLAEECTPVLRRLAEETGDTSFFFVRHGNDAICLAQEQGSYYIQTPVVSVNSRHPLGVSAGGLAILCGMPAADARAILEAEETRLHAHNGLTKEEVWACYQAAQERGIAVIADRAAPGVKAIGVPICGSLGVPFAAVTLATTISRMTEEKIQAAAPVLTAAAAEIERALQRRCSSKFGQNYR